MGRKKIQIQKITDERNKQVSVGSGFLALANAVVSMAVWFIDLSIYVSI